MISLYLCAQAEKPCMTEKLTITLLELSRSTNEIGQYFHTNCIKEHLSLMKHSEYLYSPIGRLEKFHGEMSSEFYKNLRNKRNHST